MNQRQLANCYSVSETTLEHWLYKGIGRVFLKLQGRAMHQPLKPRRPRNTTVFAKSTSERVTEVDAGVFLSSKHKPGASTSWQVGLLPRVNTYSSGSRQLLAQYQRA